MCDPKRLLTPKEVADLLQINPEVIRRWLRSGKLNGVKVGADWRVREGDLASWLKPQAEKSVADDGPKMCLKFPKWLEYSGLPRQLNEKHGPEAWPIFRALVESDFDRQALKERVFPVDLEELSERTGYDHGMVQGIVRALEKEGMILAHGGTDGQPMISIRTPLPTPKLLLDIGFSQGGVRGAPDKAFGKSCIRRYLESGTS
jgi:excisionase family DNA binding protein